MSFEKYFSYQVNPAPACNGLGHSGHPPGPTSNAPTSTPPPPASGEASCAIATDGTISAAMRATMPSHCIGCLNRIRDLNPFSFLGALSTGDRSPADVVSIESTNLPETSDSGQRAGASSFRIEAVHSVRCCGDSASRSVVGLEDAARRWEVIVRHLTVPWKEFQTPVKLVTLA